jgi:hypothetical protein
LISAQRRAARSVILFHFASLWPCFRKLLFHAIVLNLLADYRRIETSLKMDSPNSSLYPTNNDSAAREKLISLRLALLKLHKTLLDMERRDYEREHGHVNTGELFRLVVDHTQFSWLHNISEFVVRIDETLAAKEPVTPEYTSVAFSLARKMFVPTESGDAFQKKYFEAIQRDPAVVIEHAELARLFSNEPPESAAR